MAQNQVNRSLRADLFEKYEELMFKTALAEMEEQESLELMSEEDTEQERMDMRAFFAQTQSKTLSIIHREFRIEKMKHFATSTLPKVGRAAAIFIAVFFVGLSTAVAMVPPVRAGVLQFVTMIAEQFMQLGAGDELSTLVDIPLGWPGDYYPSYIPKEFDFVGVDRNQCSTLYLSGEGRTLKYVECVDERQVKIDTEDAETSYVTVNDVPAMMSIKDGALRLVWSKSDTYLMIIGDVEYETAMKIAESVEILR